jgi:hypothetical protein
VQDANVQEVGRVTKLLLRIDRYVRRMGASKTTMMKTTVSACQDVIETKEG